MRPLRTYEKVFLKALGASFAVLGTVAAIVTSCFERNAPLDRPGIVETTSASIADAGAPSAAIPRASTVDDSTGGPTGIDQAAAPREPAATTSLTSAVPDEGASSDADAAVA